MVDEYDMNNDGIVTEEEVKIKNEVSEIQMREEKAETQKKMAQVAMGSMLVFTIVLFTPVISDDRVSALADLLSMFYVAQAGIVGAYMGFTSWLSKK